MHSAYKVKSVPETLSIYSDKNHCPIKSGESNVLKNQGDYCSPVTQQVWDLHIGYYTRT